LKVILASKKKEKRKKIIIKKNKINKKEGVVAFTRWQSPLRSTRGSPLIC
jgi:hypothetical protein